MTFAICLINGTPQLVKHNPKQLHKRHLSQGFQKWLGSKKLSAYANLKNYLTLSLDKNFWESTHYPAAFVADFLYQYYLKDTELISQIFAKEVEMVKERMKQSSTPINNITTNRDYYHDLPLCKQSIIPIERSFHPRKAVENYAEHYFHSPPLPSNIVTCIAKYLPQNNSCIIHGYPQLGKSSLANFYANYYLKTGTFQCILWIDYKKSDKSFREISRALKGERYNNQMNSIQQQQNYMKQLLSYLPGWLIIIDNAPDSYHIKNLLPSRRGGYTLVTTRDGNSTWNQIGYRYQLNRVPTVQTNSCNYNHLCLTYRGILKTIMMQQEEGTQEALHMLIIMSYLDHNGLTPTLIAQASPWKVGWLGNYLDQNKQIGDVNSKKGIFILKKHGILNTEQNCMEQSCQKAVRTRVKEIFHPTSIEKSPESKLFLQLFPYKHLSIYRSAIQLLQNIQRSKDLEIHLALKHAHALMYYLEYEPQLGSQLLCTIASLQVHKFSLDHFYIKKDSSIANIHKEVEAFINGYQSSSFSPVRLRKYLPFNNQDPSPASSFLINYRFKGGKSYYTSWLTKQLATKCLSTKKELHIPVWIDLALHAKNKQLPKSLVEQVFYSYGMTETGVKQMKQAASEGKVSFIFIIDNVEKVNISKNINIYKEYQLDQWSAQNKSKYIITCQKDHLKGNDRSDFFALNSKKSQETTISLLL